MRLLLFLPILILPNAAWPMDVPLGPIGGTCQPVPGSGLIEIKSVSAGGPGALAGLQVGDFIRGAEGVALRSTSSDSNNGYLGALQDLAMAIDRAEGGSGQLTLNLLRSGLGGLDVDVQVGTAGSLGPAWPLGSAKADAMYEWACAQIHSKVQASANANFGYNNGWFGMILLAHPDWNSTSGAKPYRNSINKLRTRCEDYLNGRVLEPAEAYFWNGTDVVANPANVSVGLENWEVCSSALFLALYRIKTADTTADAIVQRAAEMIAYRIQHWVQYDDPGEPHVLGGGIGRMGHGGVVGDYSHYDGTGALNIINAHALPALALLKDAGANMNTNLGASINAFTYNAGLAQPTIEEKFRICWDYVKAGTNTSGGDDDGNVGYVGPQSGWDSAGRTPGCYAGWHLYGMAANADDTDKQARMAAYVVRRWYRQQHAHAYTLGGIVLSQMAMPFLDDRSERYFQENSRLYPVLSREPDGSVSYFPGRQNNGGDSYLNFTNVGIINAAMPRAIRSGNLPGFSAPDTTRIHAWMKSPANRWPALEARRVEVNGLNQSLQVDITDANGSVLNPADYTADWTYVSGPGTATFGSANAATRTIMFPQTGTYRVKLVVNRGGYMLTEPYDFEVSTGSPPAGMSPFIVSQPSSQSADQGGAVTLMVDAQGSDPLIYQWRQDGAPIGSPGTSSTLLLDNVSAGSAGSYDCVITNAFGTTTSVTATVTVNGVGGFDWGGLWRDVFTGISGSTVADLTNSANYPNFPSSSGVITSAESPSDYADSYGQRWSGWITPPESGTYKFYLASDDESELWLSTTDKRADRVRIAQMFGWTTARNWSGGTMSGSISLTAGQRYYIEVIHKEGGGGDNAAVTWDWQSAGVWATPSNGSNPLPGAVLEHQIGGTLSDTASPPADYPPRAYSKTVMVYGTGGTAITLSGEDFESSSLTFNVTSQPTKGTLSGTAPNLTYTPTGSGSDTFRFTVNDGSQDSTEATVTLALIPKSGSDLKVWDGSQDNAWTSAANWTANAVPDSNDAVLFNSTSTANLSTVLNGDRSIDWLVVENPSGAISIVDNILTISSGVEMRAATQNLAVSSGIQAGSDQEWGVAANRTLTISGAVTGNGIITKTGPGTLNLQAVSSRTAAIVVHEGTLELDGGGWYQGHVGGTGMVTVNDGATVINVRNHAFGNSNWPNRDLTLNYGRFRLTGDTYVRDAWLTGGTIDNTTGATGSLRPRTGASTAFTVYASNVTSTIACSISFALGEAVFDVEEGAADPDLLMSGVLTGSNACLKDGDGRMTLSGNSTHSGGITIRTGRLAVTGSLDASDAVTVQGGGILEGTGNVQGSVSNSGQIVPGLDGTALLRLGSLVQDTSSSVAVELGGTMAGSEHDQLAVAGAATLAGSLNVTLAPGYTPAAGDVFLVLTCGSRNGAFASINLPALPAPMKWKTLYDPDSVPGLRLLATSPYHEWQSAHFGADAGNAAIAGEMADPNKDGDINLMHFALDTNPTNGSDKDKFVSATGDNHLTITFPVRNGAVFTGNPLSATIDGVIYQVVGSDRPPGTGNALTVSEVTPVASTGLPSLGSYDGEPGADWEYRSFRLMPSTESITRGFLWVELTQP